MTVLLGGALLIKPALALSQLAIDVDKSWQGPAVIHSPSWALYGWQDRKKITITGSVDGLLTPHRKPITVHYGAGVDAGSHIYLNYKCLTDLADIRFTNNAGVNLPYWVESYTAYDKADMWVRFDSIPAWPATVDFWIYFNNSAGLSATDGDATWIKFDDFESYAIGAVPSKWANAVDAFTTDNAQFYQGSKSGKVVVGGVAGSRSLSPPSPLTSFRVVAAFRPQATNKDIRTVLWGAGVAGPHVIFENDGKLKYYDGAMHDLQAYSANTWYRLEWNNFNFLTRKFDLYVNGIQKLVQGGFWGLANFSDTFYVYESVITQTYHIDCVFIGNWTPNEPTFSSYGTDEPYETFCGITSLKELATAMSKGDMLFRGATGMVKIVPASIGTILTTHDVGADPVWEYPP